MIPLELQADVAEKVVHPHRGDGFVGHDEVTHRALDRKIERALLLRSHWRNHRHCLS